MTLRLSSEDYEWLQKASFTMGSTPSKLVRQLIQMAINGQKAAEQYLASQAQKKEVNNT